MARRSAGKPREDHQLLVENRCSSKHRKWRALLWCWCHQLANRSLRKSDTPRSKAEHIANGRGGLASNWWRCQSPWTRNWARALWCCSRQLRHLPPVWSSTPRLQTGLRRPRRYVTPTVTCASSSGHPARWNFRLRSTHCLQLPFQLPLQCPYYCHGRALFDCVLCDPCTGQCRKALWRG